MEHGIIYIWKEVNHMILMVIPNRLGWVPDAVIIGIGFLPLIIPAAAFHLGLKDPKSLDK